MKANQAVIFTLLRSYSCRGTESALCRDWSQTGLHNRATTLGDNFPGMVMSFLSLWIQSQEGTGHDDIRESPRRKG
jgi:hypothetical protein